MATLSIDDRIDAEHWGIEEHLRSSPTTDGKDVRREVAGHKPEESRCGAYRYE